MYDVQQYLKNYGTYIYIGDRLADLELMEAEIKELFMSQLIEKQDLQMALQVIRTEMQMEIEKKKGDSKDE
ncbi:MAG: hypothetical protein K0R18_2688 [Bacillales bacterium]|jgi:uncharacterized protein YqgQ|nr:hypothetical protein [Bacillales bacterium]